MSTVCDFITRETSYTYQGSTLTYTTLKYAQWASYQYHIAPFLGELPVAFFIVQWGWETGWGGVNWSTYFNPGQQRVSCGIGSTCGKQPNGFVRFCTIRDGVMAYTKLLIAGYTHVGYGYVQGISPTDPHAGIKAAFQTVGRGYHPTFPNQIDYCGWSGVPDGSPPTAKRLWDAGGYNNGGGPGSKLIGTYEYSGNRCVRDLNYVQYTNPNLTGFTNLF